MTRTNVDSLHAIPLWADPQRIRHALGSLLGMMTMIALTSCSPAENSPTYTGYVEAEYVYVTASAPGWLVSDVPREGTQVSDGEVLFALDQELQAAAQAEAKSRFDQADALARDLDTGARDEEIRVLEAELNEAKATLKLATAERKRWTDLAERGVAPVTRRDQVIAEEETAQARVQTLQRNIEVARLAGRDAARDAAVAGRESSAAALAQAEWHLDQRRIVARTDGRVEEVFHRRGEYVTGNTPVLALLPPNGLKVRFFVPQSDLSQIAPGDEVDVFSDVESKTIQARVTFIASEAEFTPPVIYSVDSREKLVFLVEARLEEARSLHPGQPVDVRLR